MGRRVMLRLEMGTAEANALREAAHRAHMRPSVYAVDRLCRLVTYENALAHEEDETVDIETIATEQAEVSALGMPDRLTKWRDKDKLTVSPKLTSD